jgi:hypothetical protein
MAQVNLRATDHCQTTSLIFYCPGQVKEPLRRRPLCIRAKKVRLVTWKSKYAKAWLEGDSLLGSWGCLNHIIPMLNPKVNIAATNFRARGWRAQESSAGQLFANDLYLQFHLSVLHDHDSSPPKSIARLNPLME